MARSQKDISSVVSGAGLLTRIFTDLDKELRSRGGTDDDWHRLTRADGAVVITRMVDAMLEESVSGQVRFEPITVNYDRSLAEMIAAGHYGWANEDITAEHFPTEGSGQVELKPVLVHLNRFAKTAEVEAELERRGLRPGRHEEALAFGEKYPKIQREFAIVALGSVWVDSSGGRRVVYLWGDSDQRYLRLYWDDPGGRWRPRCRFLAFSK